MEDIVRIERNVAPENNEGGSKKIIYFTIAAVVLIALGLGLYFFDLIPSKIIKKVTPEKPQVIEENLVIPDTKNIVGTEARIVEKGSVETPLVPTSEGEKVIVSKAVLTVKGGYDKASAEAKNWSTDAKLVFIKSLGAVTLEGKSSQWQVAFSSAAKKGKGYEVIIQADQVVSKKEIDSVAIGAEVPKNFDQRDSIWAIEQLAAIPQFQTSSISVINFVYNYDAKAWDYVVANTFGNSAIRVR